MREVDTLEIALWVFCAGFIVKAATFAFLAWTMRGQRDLSDLGTQLRRHYISLAFQAAGLAFVFAYYASLLSGYDSWLTADQRIAMYVVDTVLVLWATVQGVILMAAYWRASHPATNTLEQEAT